MMYRNIDMYISISKIILIAVKNKNQEMNL